MCIQADVIDSQLSAADFLIQSGLASQVRFHGKRFAWFVSDVTRKDWNWLLNTMVYGQLFPTATDQERESLRRLGERWKQYEKEGKWVYEQHPFWCTGYTFWELHNEAPDLFLHVCFANIFLSSSTELTISLAVALRLGHLQG